MADLYQKIPIWTSLPRGGVPTGTETEKDRKGKDKTVIWFEGLVGAVRAKRPNRKNSRSVGWRGVSSAQSGIGQY